MGLYWRSLAVSLLSFVILITAYGQTDDCCRKAFKTCSVCRDGPDTTQNLNYGFCEVTGYDGQSSKSPGASAKLKACQQCVDSSCPVKGGTKDEDKPIDKNKVVQIRPPTDSYSWCVDAFSSVFVEKMPQNPDSLAAMAVVNQDGTIGDIYTIDERAKVSGRTVVIVPETDGHYSQWQVHVNFGGYADDTMDAGSVIRLPCFARDTIKERFNAQVEFSGGVMNWFINAVKLRDYPVDFPELNNFATKEAIGGVREQTQNYYWPKMLDFDLVRAAYFPNKAPDLLYGGISIVIDAHTPGMSRFSIQGADLLLTPTNGALQPFTLRSGQQVSISQTSIGPVTRINSDPGTSGAATTKGCGIGRRWNLRNEYGATAVWTRDGTSNVFDAVYSYPDGSRLAEKDTVSLDGNAITARVDYGIGIGSCVHTGTLSADGKSASGTFTCTTQPAKRATWSAQIFCE